MANNLEIEAQRQALVTSIRLAAQALRDCANKTDDFANYLQNVFPVPQPYSTHSQPSSYAPPLGLAPAPTDGAPAKRKPGRPKKVDHEEDGGAADDGAANGEGKKRKRQTKEKKPKDPNAPKRPPSAYLLYQNQVRKEVQAANPNLPYSEILSYISKSWGQLSDAEKAPYNEATELAKAQYEQKKSVYEAGLKAAEAAKSPTTPASAPTHHDTEEEDGDDDDEPSLPPPAPSPPPAPVRTKQSSAAQRAAPVVHDEDESSDSTEDSEEEDEETAPPPKKKPRKSEPAPPPPPPPPAVSKEKEKEKEKVKKEKERKEKKEKKERKPRE